MNRAFDLVLSFCAVVLLSPVIAVVAALVWALLGRPVLFQQPRLGLGGRAFVLYKFRTMIDLRAPSGQPLGDERRLPRFGRFLRATSLDELPELFNVLKGDMSLVGPRPLLPEYLPYYSTREARRHEVRPGITGWAQVNGRNALDWEEKFELDVWYVDHRSLPLDLKILALTVWQLLRPRGISHAGHVTMPKLSEVRRGRVS